MHLEAIENFYDFMHFLWFFDKKKSSSFCLTSFYLSALFNLSVIYPSGILGIFQYYLNFSPFVRHILNEREERESHNKDITFFWFCYRKKLLSLSLSLDRAAVRVEERMKWKENWMRREIKAVWSRVNVASLEIPTPDLKRESRGAADDLMDTVSPKNNLNLFFMFR